MQCFSTQGIVCALSVHLLIISCCKNDIYSTFHPKRQSCERKDAARRFRRSRDRKFSQPVVVLSCNVFLCFLGNRRVSLSHSHDRRRRRERKGQWFEKKKKKKQGRKGKEARKTKTRNAECLIFFSFSFFLFFFFLFFFSSSISFLFCTYVVLHLCREKNGV